MGEGLVGGRASAGEGPGAGEAVLDAATGGRGRGVALVVSAPSGAGKSTVIRRVVATTEGVEAAVSATTRPPRGEERDGVDYEFVDHARFATLRSTGAFLEHAEVHGNLYGTRRAPLEAALAAGRDVILDIDWQGARAARAALGADVASVFILPPSMGELRRRLEARGEDDAATIARRLANAEGEVLRSRTYDYLVVNEDVGEACARVRAILLAEGARAWRLRAGRGATGSTGGGPGAGSHQVRAGEAGARAWAEGART